MFELRVESPTSNQYTVAPPALQLNVTLEELNVDPGTGLSICGPAGVGVGVPCGVGVGDGFGVAVAVGDGVGEAEDIVTASAIFEYAELPVAL